MGLLILLGVIVGSAVVLLGIFRMMSENRSGPVIPMVRIGIANTNLEAEMWIQRLGVSGIKCHIVGLAATEGGAIAPDFRYRGIYEIELWVAKDDEVEARKALGLPAYN